MVYLMAYYKSAPTFALANRALNAQLLQDCARDSLQRCYQMSGYDIAFRASADATDSCYWTHQQNTGGEWELHDHWYPLPIMMRTTDEGALRDITIDVEGELSASGTPCILRVYLLPAPSTTISASVGLSDETAYGAYTFSAITSFTVVSKTITPRLVTHATGDAYTRAMVPIAWVHLLVNLDANARQLRIRSIRIKEDI